VSSRGAVTAAVGVLALGLGLVVGEVGLSIGTDRDRTGLEKTSGDLRTQVLQPPDASQLECVTRTSPTVTSQ
jgi:hypothetical protein